MELTGSLAGFANSVLQLETEKNDLTIKVERANVDLAVANSRIQMLEEDKRVLTSKLEYYQRRTTEIITKLNGFGSMILDTLREEPLSEFKPNGAAKIQKVEPLDMPKVLSKMGNELRNETAPARWMK